jgi:hypothetical protein
MGAAFQNGCIPMNQETAMNPRPFASLAPRVPGLDLHSASRAGRGVAALLMGLALSAWGQTNPSPAPKPTRAATAMASPTATAATSPQPPKPVGWQRGPNLDVFAADRVFGAVLRSLSPSKMLVIHGQTLNNVRQLYATEADLSTATFSTPTRLPAVAGDPLLPMPWMPGDVSNVAMAPVGPEGDLLVSWVSLEPGTPNNSYSFWWSRRSTTSGQWSTPQRWLTTLAETRMFLAEDGKGAVALGVRITRRDDTNWSDYQVLHMDANWQSRMQRLSMYTGRFPRLDPRLALSDSGRLAVSWINDLSMLQLAVEGTPSWDAPIGLGYMGFSLRVENGGSAHTKWAMQFGPQDEMQIAWYTQAADVRAMRLDAQLQTLADARLRVDGAAQAFAPSLSRQPQGAWVATFLAGEDGTKLRPYATRYTPATGWSAPALLADLTFSDTLQLHPQADGKLAAVAISGTRMVHGLIEPATLKSEGFQFVYQEPYTNWAYGLDATNGRALALRLTYNRDTKVTSFVRR